VDRVRADLVLVVAVLGQQVDDGTWQRDRAPSGFGLERTQGAVARELLGHPHPAAVEVDVLPSEPEQFGLASAAGVGEHDQHVQRVVARGGEDACLLAARERPTLCGEYRGVVTSRPGTRRLRGTSHSSACFNAVRSVLCASLIVRGPLPAFNSSR
jgi:hypothetical protein